MKEALSSSEMSVLTRATRRNMPEDTTLLVQLTLREISQNHKVNTLYITEWMIDCYIL
jgi:hypothetical protein